MRDCSGPNADYDYNYKVSVLDGQSLQVLQSLSLYSSAFPLDSIDFSLPPCYSTPNICVERKIFLFPATLPANPNGYWITYARCCRNATVSNIYSPLETGFTLSTFIPATNIINSSPTFNIAAPNLVCAGDSFNLNLSATDIDGDSLVYDFSEAYIGGNTNSPIPSNVLPADTAIIWLPNYDYQHPFGINTYTSLNSQTGNLKGFSTHIGQYVFAIKVKEYRNGILLGETRREMELNIINCTTYDTPPTFNFTLTNMRVGDTLYFSPNVSNYAMFSMTDFRGNSNVAEPLIYGEITGGVFDSTQFTNIATASNPASGPSPLNGSIIMTPSVLDANKLAKSYVHIWRTDSCFNSTSLSLLDSFYVRIIPCSNTTPPPIIAGLQALSNSEIFVEWQTFSATADFGYYMLERADPDYIWELLGVFPNSTTWAYLDTSAHNNDSIPYCYRIGVVSLCNEENTIHYSADSCTFYIQTKPEKRTASINCYPNPSQDGLIKLNMKDFEDTKVTVKVLDIYGKIVFEKYFEEKVQGDISLKLDDLSKTQEVYYIQVVSDEKKPKIASTILVMQK